jgi:hypothetical protein
MEVKVDKDKKENYPVFLDGESVGGKVNYNLIVISSKMRDLNSIIG